MLTYQYSSLVIIGGSRNTEAIFATIGNGWESLAFVIKSSLLDMCRVLDLPLVGNEIQF